MPQAVLIARLLLVGVFGVAGVAKLRDRPGSLQALLGFGLPELLAAPVAVLLPLTELTVAALLVVPASARWSAGAAAVLATVFALAIAHALRTDVVPTATASVACTPAKRGRRHSGAASFSLRRLSLSPQKVPARASGTHGPGSEKTGA